MTAPDHVPAVVVAGAGRLNALQETGLSATADAGMDRFARLVTSVLGVPVALVSLVEPTRQVFPGMVGLAEPWAARRATPLTHSLCQHVVTEGAPLILEDAREDARTCTSLAIGDLGVVGYAGMPLTDSDGHVLGSLCAIDTKPRHWSRGDLNDLEDLAAACSAELRLRIISRQREHARHDEAEARERADALTIRTESSLSRSQLLLRAADVLANTTGLVEVRQALRDLVTSDLGPAYVGLSVVEGKRIRRLVDRGDAPLLERLYENYDLASAWPTARAARENITITINGLAELEAGYSPDTLAPFIDLRLETAVCVPLPGTHIPLGTLVMAWDRPFEIDITDQAVLAALAGYTARAVERALFVENRIDVAQQLQQAMLTTLPAVPGLEISALYRSAAEEDMVGGDWYDAYPLPAPGQDRKDASTRATHAISVGDITGHDMRAATLMGQIRSMLRQADLDHPGQGPARAVRALEHANRHLNIQASGTLLHAHLRPMSAGPDGLVDWEMTWTNAGHPPPLLVQPDGSIEALRAHDMLFHPLVSPGQRTDHRVRLRPGALLLLYTDGLVEQRHRSMDASTAEVADLLADHRGQPLDLLLKVLIDRSVGLSPGDDVALLALRVPSSV